MAEGQRQTPDYQQAICRIASFLSSGELGEVVGAGFLVSDRHILTCAHVVNAALGQAEEQTGKPQEEIKIEFSYLGQGQWLRCQVVYWLPMNGKEMKEDIAVLRLLEPVRFSPVAIAPQDPEEKSILRTYGFPDQGLAYGSGSDCCLHNYSLVKSYGWGQVEDQSGVPICKGFSGSMLWDPKANQVAGMVVAAEYRKTREGRVPERSFMIRASVLREVLRSVELLELLALYGEGIQKQLQAAYQACRPALLRTEGLAKDSDFGTLVKQLEDLDLHEPGCFWKFVTLLVEDSSVPANGLRVDLAAWASRLCPDFSQLRSAARQMLTAQQGQHCPVQSAVLVILEPVAQKAGYFRPKVIAIPNCDVYEPQRARGAFNLLSDATAQEYPLDLLPELLAPCLEQVSCFFSVAPTLEIFLPLNQLNTAVDAWEVIIDDLLDETDWLGNQYDVRLRSYERAAKPAKLNWKNRWDVLEKEGESPAFPYFNRCNGKDLNKLKVDLTNPGVIGVCFTQSPAVGKGSPLASVLANGIPAALWVRQDLDHCNCPEELKALLVCQLKRLPQTIRAQWQAAYGSGVDHQAPLEQTQLGHHLSLLWDNPKLLPPEPTQTLLQMPS